VVKAIRVQSGYSSHQTQKQQKRGNEKNKNTPSYNQPTLYTPTLPTNKQEKTTKQRSTWAIQQNTHQHHPGHKTHETTRPIVTSTE